MTKKESKIMRLTTSSHFLVHLFEGVIPPLIPLLILEFNADYFQIGLIVSIFSYAFGFFAIPAGIISDKFYPKHLITIFLFGAGIFSCITFNVSSILGYGILMGIIGIFAAIYHPAANTLIAHSIKNKGTGFGIHGVAGSLGIASVPAISALIAAAAGWRAPHIIYGIIGITIAFYSLRIPKNNQIAKPNIETDKEEKKQKIEYYPLIIFFATACFIGLTYKGIMTFLPTYMGEKIDFDFIKTNKVALGGFFTTFSLLFGTAGQYISGKLTDKYQPEKIYFFIILFGAVCVSIIPFASDFILIAAAAFYAFFYFSVQPIQNYIISLYLPYYRHGTGYGILFMSTFGVGSTAAFVSGYIADKFGLTAVFYLMSVCYTITAVIALLLYNIRRKKI